MKKLLLASTILAPLALLGCGKSEEDVNAERMQKALNQPRPDMTKAPRPNVTPSP